MDRTGKEYPPDAVWKAQEMYCVDRMSFDAVAEATGIAASTLKRWSERFQWRAKREEIAREESELRANKVKARSVMLRELIETRNPQAGFAVASLESIALREAEAALKHAATRKKLEDAKKPQEFCSQDENSLPKTDEERRALLRQALDRELARLLTAPAGDLAAGIEKLHRLFLALREDAGASAGISVQWADAPVNDPILGNAGGDHG